MKTIAGNVHFVTPANTPFRDLTRQSPTGTTGFSNNGNTVTGKIVKRWLDERSGVRSDQLVWLAHLKSIEHYPERFRWISYRDTEADKARSF